MPHSEHIYILLKTILKNIYDEEELPINATCKDSLRVRQEGNCKVKRTLAYYNIDAIISVGYRVKSKIAVKVR